MSTGKVFQLFIEQSACLCNEPLLSNTFNIFIVADTERMEYRTNLQINYCNGISQTHPLVATVSCPSFKLSTDSIDYGLCFVGQEIHHLVTIVNQSGADSRWRARVEGTAYNFFFLSYIRFS